MQCCRCKNNMILTEKKHIIQLGAKTIILENTPVLQCSHCCEEYMESNVIQKIENIEHNFENINFKIAIMDYKEE